MLAFLNPPESASAILGPPSAALSPAASESRGFPNLAVLLFSSADEPAGEAKNGIRQGTSTPSSFATTSPKQIADALIRSMLSRSASGHASDYQVTGSQGPASQASGPRATGSSVLDQASFYRTATPPAEPSDPSSEESLSLYKPAREDLTPENDLRHDSAGRENAAKPSLERASAAVRHANPQWTLRAQAAPVPAAPVITQAWGMITEKVASPNAAALNTATPTTVPCPAVPLPSPDNGPLVDPPGANPPGGIQSSEGEVTPPLPHVPPSDSTMPPSTPADFEPTAPPSSALATGAGLTRDSLTPQGMRIEPAGAKAGFAPRDPSLAFQAVLTPKEDSARRGELAENDSAIQGAPQTPVEAPPSGIETEPSGAPASTHLSTTLETLPSNPSPNAPSPAVSSGQTNDGNPKYVSKPDGSDAGSHASNLGANGPAALGPSSGESNANVVSTASLPAETLREPEQSGIPAETKAPGEPTELRDAPSVLQSTLASGITVRLAGPGAPPVDLHISDRAGQLWVAVRTPDLGLQTSLRQDLGTLVNNLDRSGFHTELIPQREEAPCTGSQAFSEGCASNWGSHESGNFGEDAQSSTDAGRGAGDGQPRGGQGNNRGSADENAQRRQRRLDRWMEEFTNA